MNAPAPEVRRAAPDSADLARHPRSGVPVRLYAESAAESAEAQTLAAADRRADTDYAPTAPSDWRNGCQDGEGVENPKARWIERPMRTKPSPARVRGGRGRRNALSIYQRQNLARTEDFSCGIRFHPAGGPPLTLARYNGGSHIHHDIAYAPHIHRATQRAMEAGERPESEAEPTTRFRTLEGALACLLEDFHVTGLSAKPAPPRLLS